MSMKRCSVIVAIFCLFGVQSVHGEQIRIDIENAQGAGGFYFTPVWVGFHDGSFDLFDQGGNSSAGLEALAEGGDTSGVSAEFMGSGLDATIAATGSGPPPFDPGESVSTTFDLDPTDNRFFSYASMIIPSNDAFIGNDNAAAYEIFDVGGNFNGTISFEVLASEIWDAGTEVNDINGGAAFSANGGASSDEDNPIDLITLSELNLFVGSQTAAGTSITTPLGPNDVVARITISAVPEPGSFGVLAVAGLASLMRRRRK